MFLFVLMLEAATPSAISLVVICTLHNDQESEMSAILFYQYVAALPLLTLSVAVMLYLLVTIF